MPTHSSDCFALLDDCNATADAPGSRLCTGYLRTLACDDADGLPQLFDRLERALREGFHAVGLFSYELGAQMHGIVPPAGAHGGARILLFEQCVRMSADEVDRWLAERAPDLQAAGIMSLSESVDDTQFEKAVAHIHDRIAAGDAYQVNYTYRLRFDAYGEPLALYRRLRLRQPVPYGALVALPDGGAVLSLSPELFVQHHRGRLMARPMKGTVAATGDAGRDAAQAKALADDPKNRAENLMIVDLLRNDLGRVAETGTVRVPELFRVDQFGSVLQMTSTVEASPRAGATLADLFAALFPCGSVTGAPKRRSMQIIRELEPDARGVYTGAIGWFDAPGINAGMGDFCLSVPIRTLTLDAVGNDGLRRGELGIGAGIVHDSRTAQEREECRLKARFLTALPHEFALFETMHATREQGCRHLERHVRRLRDSAAFFGFAFDERAICQAVHDACTELAPGLAHRLRLALRCDGSIELSTAPLVPICGPVRILLAGEVMQSLDPFLQHKTTLRARYDAAWRAAEAQGAFDAVFMNERGEITEGGRSNLFAKLGGRWVTPPHDAGVLPGVMRAALLADPAWNATEDRLTPGDLYAAEALVVCNALRGAMPAILA